MDRPQRADSDDDGILDADEAGDDDLGTEPVDSDDDGIPDFRDPDSDNDGVADASEAGFGTRRTLADTDMDGVTDLVEALAGTDATEPSDNPLVNGDFFFEVPFQEAPNPPRSQLSFQTAIRKADVYFSIHTSTTMGGEIAALRDPLSGIAAVIESLQCPVVGGSCSADAGCASGQVCGGNGVCVEAP